MNLIFAREVGLPRYFWRRAWWRLLQAAGLPREHALPTGLSLPLPRGNFFASDVYVTDSSVDWLSEHILARHLKEKGAGRDFLDVGAHIGYYSLLYAPLVRRVAAFEPDPRNQAAMAATAAQVKNMAVVVAAVADRPGEVGFCEGEASSVSHLASPTDQKAQTVTAVTLDAFVPENGYDPAAVKVDIEGFDILALEGAVETARQHRPVFLVEYNLEEDRPNAHERLEAWLRAAGYRLYAVVRHEVPPLSCRYEFKGLQALELGGLFTKMLFLVPAEETWFEEFGRRNPAWPARSLRRHGVRAVLEGRPVPR